MDFAPSSAKISVILTDAMIEAATAALADEGFGVEDDCYPVAIEDPVAARRIVEAALRAGGFDVQNEKVAAPKRESLSRNRARAST